MPLAIGHGHVRTTLMELVGWPMRCPSWWLASALLSFAPRALADGSHPAVRMVWVRGAGGESCPDGDEMARRVTARLGRPVFSSAARGAIEGFVERDDQRWTARVFVRGENGALQGSRVLTNDSSDCDGLSAAVELVIALTLDPDAPLGPIAPDRGPPAAPAPVPPPAAPPVAVAGAQGARLADAQGGRLAVSARTLLAAGLLPGAALGVALGTEVMPAGWPLHVTAGLAYFPEHAADIPGVAFGLSAGWLGVCVEPLKGRLVEGTLCSAVFLGALHSSVSNTQALANGDRIWSAAALSAQLRLRMASQVFAELGGEALAPLQTPSFGVVGGSSTPFREAQVCADAFVGVGVSIP